MTCSWSAAVGSSRWPAARSSLISRKFCSVIALISGTWWVISSSHSARRSGSAYSCRSRRSSRKRSATLWATRASAMGLLRSNSSVTTCGTSSSSRFECLSTRRGTMSACPFLLLARSSHTHVSTSMETVTGPTSGSWAAPASRRGFRCARWSGRRQSAAAPPAVAVPGRYRAAGPGGCTALARRARDPCGGGRPG
jgi:hypothetical protein